MSFCEQDQGALAHGEFAFVVISERLDEIGAEKVPRLNLERIGFAFGFEAFGGG